MFRLLCSLLALALCTASVGAQDVLSGMAALVNNDVITFGQLRELVGEREANARANLNGPAQLAAIKQIRLAALNELIDRQLILQEFKKLQKEKGFQIPPHIVDEHIETIIREQYGNDRQAFIRTLAAQGLTMEKFREAELDKIIVQAMRAQMVKSSSIVAEPRVLEYYQKNIDHYTSEEQMHLRMVVLRKGVGEGTPRRLMMEEIRDKVRGGAPFESLARMYDEGSPDQENRGDWGWINRSTLNESLTREAFALRPGEVSSVLEVGDSYYLLYCEERKPAVTKSIDEVREEIERKVLQEDRQQQQQAWLQKLRSKAFIKIF